MLRTSIMQKQCEVYNRNELMSKFLLEHSSLEPSFIIKTMMWIIKIKSKDSMDAETQVQFSKIADEVVRIAEDIREQNN